MSNYLKITFKCDLILQIFFYILGGRGGPFLEGTYDEHNADSIYNNHYNKKRNEEIKLWLL